MKFCLKGSCFNFFRLKRFQWKLEFHLHVSHLQAVGFDSRAGYVSAEISVFWVDGKRSAQTEIRNRNFR